MCLHVFGISLSFLITRVYYKPYETADMHEKTAKKTHIEQGVLFGHRGFAA
jgi:hypothetical protein